MTIQLLDKTCPVCQSVNWLNNGDISDLTAPDVEAARCWSCQTEFFVAEDLDVMYGEDISPCDVIIQDGKRTAAEAV